MDDSPVTKVIFNAGEVRTVLDSAIQHGLDSLWLLRSPNKIQLTYPVDRMENMTEWVMPTMITKTRTDLFPVRPVPFIDIIPHHDCVIRAISREMLKALFNMRLEIHFNTVSEYKLYLTRRHHG